ncbi:MAG: tetrathionate reductase family octaheme c-type cytochrome, partial [Deltaproteobacteria bacterium]|nr:tetrathionate reductase family octaheme c-type cytochrome [Deltaproteobacteria bacterium]
MKVRTMQPLLALALLVMACGGEEKLSGPWAHVPKRKTATDHTSFFNQSFKDGPAVTKACLECHPEASKEVMKTSHWRWEAADPVLLPGRKEPLRLGKKNAFNNFCIAATSNEKMCTKCHVGYGWKDKTFDFADETRVDCLACHDKSGTYAKQDEGLPVKGVDLLAAARSVGRTSRGTCGNCHFFGGGGNSVKHGDMSATLFNPADHVDVHMGKHNLVCADCHRAKDHDILGRAMSVSPSAPIKGRIACTDCHKGDPHKDARLNKHLKKVSCQACHIPQMNREEATKMTWDWSKAGQENDIKDPHVYLKIKGRFTYEKGATPTYRWYNKNATHYVLGDTIDPTKVTKMDAPIGARKMAGSQIWPFKVHRGKQPYDKVHNYFLVPNLVGDEGYWKKFDWDLALKNGAKKTGLPYSGEYAFAATEMYWPLTHMVVAKEDALGCGDCHGPSGRLDWKGLGYERDPLAKGAA